jgi:fatty-acyl-CoA synthase
MTEESLTISKVEGAGRSGFTARDISAKSAWIRALGLSAPIAKNPNRTFAVVLDELAARHGEAPALLAGGGMAVSYRGLAELANRYARWGGEQGLGKGDGVCLLMPNSLDYLAIWLGLSGIGCIVALINSNLAGASLAHCIDAAMPKVVIVSERLAAAYIDAEPLLKSRPKVWAQGTRDDIFPTIDRAVASLSGAPLDPALRSNVSIKDPALYIYTSGTTGLPKAAKVSHYRIMAWSHWFAGLMGVTANDRLYNCLPMYHSVGGVAAPCALLVGGGSIVIREKFSARQFWKDVTEERCTIFQYIGELCRYLVNTPPDPYEREHRLRLCCGNGLSAVVWEKFQERFRIPQILEFYAATEGTFSLYNVEGERGSIGRVPSFIPQSLQIKLIKYDAEKDTVLRDDDGFCVPCGFDEPGEAIGRISSDRAGAFEGYATPADTEKKILRNAFEPGDAWFRTGDLMLKDRRGFFYFIDRIGDTFRWKGENVATSEVRDAISAVAGVLDATVYGVPVPGSEGRAGMAAIVAGPAFDLQILSEHLGASLPSYARPLFLRVEDKIDVTSTFKHTKAGLVRDGFDPAKIAGTLYFRDPETQRFVHLDETLFREIAAGTIKL